MKKTVTILLSVLCLSACSFAKGKDSTELKEDVLPMPSKSEADDLFKRTFEGNARDKFFVTDGHRFEKISHPAVEVSDLCVQNERLFLTDWKGHQVHVLDLSNQKIENFGELGSGLGQLNGPTAIASQGEEIYVLDANNYRIQVFDQNFKAIDSIDLPEGFIESEDSHTMAADSRGNLYITTDNMAYGHILRYDRESKSFSEIGENFIGTVASYAGDVYGLNATSLIGSGKEKNTTHETRPYKHYLFRIQEELQLLKEIDEALTPSAFRLNDEGLLLYSSTLDSVLQYDQAYEFETNLVSFSKLKPDSLPAKLSVSEDQKEIYLCFPLNNTIFKVVVD